MADEPGTRKTYTESDTDEPGESDTGKVERQRAQGNTEGTGPGDEPRVAQEPPD